MPLALLWPRQDEEGSPDATPDPTTDGPGETTTPPPDDEPTTSPDPTSTHTSTSVTHTSSTTTRTTTTTKSGTKTQTSSPPPSSSSSTSSTTGSNSDSLSTTLSNSAPPPSTPSGPAFQPGNTQTVDPTDNFVDPTGVSNDFNSEINPVPTQSTISAPSNQEGSSKSTALPIVLPCLLIPIALAAILMMLIRRRRQQHSQMLDEFTNRSTFYAGAAPGADHDNYSGKEVMMAGGSSNHARSPSLASSRYREAYGPTSPSGAGSHMDSTMPPMVHNQAYLSPGSPGFATAAAPNRGPHARTGSDDLDIKCAGRIESSASFGAIYDQYGGGAQCQTPGADGGAGDMAAYDRSSAAAPMPDHPYASAQPQAYPSSYQQQNYYGQAPQSQYNAYSQQAQYATYPQHDQYATYSQQQAQYPAYNQQQSYPMQQYQPQQGQQSYPPYTLAATSSSAMYAPGQSTSSYNQPQPGSSSSAVPPRSTPPPITVAHSRTLTNTPPQLDLPAFSFDMHNLSNTASPISAVFRSDDPFADPGSAGAAAAATKVPTANDFPSPPVRASMERRAARTRSVEQRLMMALGDTQRATAIQE